MSDLTINPENVRLAVEASSLDVEYISKNMKRSVKVIRKWITGEERKMSFSEAVRLGSILGVNPNVFFVNRKFEEPPAPVDFRLKKGAEKLKIKSIKQIRKMLYLRDELYEIVRGLGEDTSWKIGTADLRSDPAGLASEYRKKLDLDSLVAEKMTDEEFFERIRETLLDKNVAVFVDSFPEEENIKGLSLSDDKIPIIVVNRSDSDIRSKIFTVFHEFAHLLLRNNAMCNVDESLTYNGTDGVEYETERWCNRFSANILLPPDVIKEKFKGIVEIERVKKIAGKLSSKYHVSKSTIYYSLSDNGIINRMQLKILLPGIPEREGGRGRNIPLEKKRIRMLGKKASRLIFYAHDESIITTHDVLSIFSIKLKDYDRARDYAVR
jgi:Zn-dependent peptidase ImmA (M78 family)